MSDCAIVINAKEDAMTIRCDGWRRYGGAFTFGPV